MGEKVSAFNRPNRMKGCLLTMNKIIRKSVASVMHCAVSDAPAASGTPEDPPDVVITIKTSLAGKVEFVFQDYKIHFRPDARYGRPSGATVNGIPWPDLEKPFEMGFTPDFSFADIYDQSGRGAIELTVKPDRFILSVDDSESGFAPYQISISMKRQPATVTPDKPAPDVKRSPASSSGRPSARPVNFGKPAKKKKKR